MDVLDYQRQLETKIKQLEEARDELQKLIDDNTKSKTAAEYDKELAITILKLRSGEPMEFEGETFKGLPVSINEKVAKGICWKQKLAMDSASEKQKLLLKKIDLREAQLNAYQSLHKNFTPSKY